MYKKTWLCMKRAIIPAAAVLPATVTVQARRSGLDGTNIS
jgi:hypothetical protein